jgi:hypothetical protein
MDMVEKLEERLSNKKFGAEDQELRDRLSIIDDQIRKQ